MPAWQRACGRSYPALECAPCTAQRSRRHRAVSSAVEHYLDMVGVTGSNPVPPTTCNASGAVFSADMRFPASASTHPVLTPAPVACDRSWVKSSTINSTASRALPRDDRSSVASRSCVPAAWRPSGLGTSCAGAGAAGARWSPPALGHESHRLQRYTMASATSADPGRAAAETAFSLTRLALASPAR